MAKKYVDVDRLFYPLYCEPLDFSDKEKVTNFITKLPAADVVEVRHGRWIIDEWNTPNCSVCGCSGIDDYYATPYCPHCGAKMDEVEE